MRHAATLATPETECLLYATYWFRPILSELIGAATETALINRNRAPSGPVKVTVTTQPHERPHGGISLTSGVSLKIVPHRWSCQKFVSRLGVFHSRIMETFELWNQRLGFGSLGSPFFLTGALCLSAGRGVLRLTRLPRHDRSPVPGGNRSAASCLCTVLRRALYHYTTRSPDFYGRLLM